jgi:hypothetical protein
VGGKRYSYVERVVLQGKKITSIQNAIKNKSDPIATTLKRWTGFLSQDGTTIIREITQERSTLHRIQRVAAQSHNILQSLVGGVKLRGMFSCH